MSLDELYRAVTEAIFLAETCEAEGRARDTALAYLRVSQLEGEIAALLPASDPEGALARQGVVTAAMSAGDISRAIERARVYGADVALSAAFREQIDALRKEAEDKVRELQGGDEPRVRPITFSLVLGDAA
jgi:hypothetical protein